MVKLLLNTDGVLHNPKGRKLPAYSKRQSRDIVVSDSIGRGLAYN